LPGSGAGRLSGTVYFDTDNSVGALAGTASRVFSVTNTLHT